MQRADARLQHLNAKQCQYQTTSGSIDVISEYSECGMTAALSTSALPCCSQQRQLIRSGKCLRGCGDRLNLPGRGAPGRVSECSPLGGAACMCAHDHAANALEAPKLDTAGFQHATETAMPWLECPHDVCLHRTVLLKDWTT